MRKIIQGFLVFVLACTGCSKPEEPIVEEYAARQLPSLYTRYVYMIDSDTGQILVDQESQERIYPASITKMMTVIVAMEHINDLEETFLITPEVMTGLIEASANRAGFLAGDEPTLEDLLYGALLPSGAECTQALAYYVSGGVEPFVDLMNQKAMELGMFDTHFVNTTGLHADDHYSTCRDLAILMKYCMQNKTFMEILSAPTHTAIATRNYRNGLGMANGVLQYINQEEPLYQNFEIPGFIAGKSGYTLEGLYTLASCAEENDVNLILIDCYGYYEPHYPASIADAAELYNWFRENYSRKTLFQAGDLLKTVSVKHSTVSKIDFLVPETITMDLPSEENIHVEIHLPDTLEGGIEKGTTLGSLEIYAYDELVYTHEFTAETDYPKQTNTLTNRIAEYGFVFSILGLIVIFAILLYWTIDHQNRVKRSKKRRNQRKPRI